MSLHARWLLASMIVWATVFTAAPAQELMPKYKTIPIKARDPKTKQTVTLDSKQITKQVSALRTKLISDLKFGKATLDSKKKKELDAYYLRMFALMAQPDQLGKVATHRQKMLSEIRGVKAQDAHDYLVSRVLFFCSKLIPSRKGMNYSAVARHNCMLILAGLNRVEMKGGSNGVPEVALAQARRPMLDQLKDPNQIDAVRVAALVGLKRHAELSRFGGQARSIPADEQAEMTKAATDLLSQQEAPGDRSTAAHVWFQRLAADILGALGDPGPSGEVAKLLDQTVRNKGVALSLRCSASNALGRMKYTKTVGLQADASAAGMGSVAVAACRAELDRIEKAIEAKQSAQGGGLGGYGGVPGGGGYDSYERGGGVGSDAVGGDGGYPYGPGAGGIPGQQPLEPQEDPIITATRRQLKHHLNCVSTGLVGEPPKREGGMLSLAQGQQQNAVKSIVQGVSNLMKTLDEPTQQVEKFKEKLKKQADTLERVSSAMLAAR